MCAFCPGEADSGEHIWSAWIGDLFPSSRYNFRRVNTLTGERAAWHAPTLDEKTKVVCRQCNNTWMSDLESRSKVAFSDMISEGGGISLLSRGSILLAQFAFKCAVIADHSSPSGGTFFNQFSRNRFRTSLEIPSGIRMWLAAFRDPIGHKGAFINYRTSPSTDGFRDLQFYVFTFLAGHLAFQLHATRWIKLDRMGEPFPIVELGTPWDTSTTVEFWPCVGFPVSWPPRYLSADTLDKFAYRWTQSVRLSI